jgi:hypothetical protein
VGIVLTLTSYTSSDRSSWCVCVYVSVRTFVRVCAHLCAFVCGWLCVCGCVRAFVFVVS